MNRRADAPQRAVLYLRVSTVSQVTTDYDPEGISIPAQRAACQRKAEQLGIEIVDEYVEPGRSGTSMKSRPAFQAMLKRIRQDRDVDAVLVYKLSRMNRNWEESAQVIMQLRAAQAQLLSATENIDETPVGRLTLGIMSAINEFRSAEDGEDIRYKMGEKAKRGGTINKAPLGYKNVREEFEGRLVPSVALDPERAPLIRQAFELYASGDYSLDRLTQTMADLGLRSRPTKRFPAKPVSLEQLRLILANPYYTGVLVYRGALYPGRHEAIIDAPLFERVQEVADLRSRRGSRDHIHQHFLKGMLFCGRCQRAGREHRLILTEARGRTGFYFYFLCRGRQEGECDLPYLRVEQVEDAVEREYAHLALPADFAAQVEARVRATIADEQRSARLLRTNLNAELARLSTAEERLIDLAAEGTLPVGKVRSRLTKLQQDQERVRDQLETIEHDLAEGAEALTAALRLLDKPQQLFQEAGETTRRLLTQTFFERLYIDDDDVTAVRYQRPFGDLHAAGRAWLTASAGRGRRTGRRQAKSPDTTRAEALQGSWADLLASVSLDAGSSKTVLVEVAGIEPASFDASPGLLRAQSALPLLGPIDHADKSM